jgi:hypothetical protein
LLGRPRVSAAFDFVESDCTEPEVEESAAGVMPAEVLGQGGEEVEVDSRPERAEVDPLSRLDLEVSRDRDHLVGLHQLR